MIRTAADLFLRALAAAVIGLAIGAALPPPPVPATAAEVGR